MSLKCKYRDNCESFGKCQGCIVINEYGTNLYKPIDKRIKNEIIEEINAKVYEEPISLLDKIKFNKKSNSVREAFELEEKIAKEIGGETTVMSGAINHDGDIRKDGWIIDHKRQENKIPQINIQQLDKVRYQAYNHNKNGCLIITHSETGRKFLVIDLEDTKDGFVW